jgi:uncharacterized protein (TIGR00299 family) protein
MRVLHYDCFSGISGDMNLGAMLDIGVGEQQLRDSLSLLELSEEYQLKVGRERRKGISGTRVEISLGPTQQLQHRHLGDIVDIIKGSSLPAYVREKSIETFKILARAEAKVHGTSVEEVHFHEVGATDAILDIVGAAVCMDILGIDAVYASPIELGGGFVDCAHGRMPVPAPATAEILTGAPVRMGAVDTETTTPTGAALLRTYVREYRERPCFSIERVGYGIGARDTAIPNVLRAFIGSSPSTITEKWDTGQAIILETTIDDMNPELYEHVFAMLFSQGARDVYTTPATMKKGRPGTMLSVLCEVADEHKRVETLFSETTTLGVRSIPVAKHMMRRSIRTVHTPFGPVRVKSSYLGESCVKEKPEHDDCRKLAIAAGVPLYRVYRAALQAMGDGNVP